MFNSKKQMALYNVLWQSNEQKTTAFTMAQAISFAFWAAPHGQSPGGAEVLHCVIVAEGQVMHF